MRRKYIFCASAPATEAGRAISELAAGFAARGHDVILACERPAGENFPAPDERMRLVTLRPGLVAGTRDLARLLREERPDAALSGSGASNLKLFVAAGLTGSLKRSAQSLHGYFQCEPELLNRLGALLLPVSSRIFARTVTASDGLGSYLRRRFQASPERMLRIYNPVWARSAQARHAGDLARRAPVVLACGGFTPDRNFPALVRAFAHVAYPGARLALLGNGEDRPRIEAEVARLHLADRVTLADDSPELWYEKARVFASSAERAAFGVELVEALAFGLPVVATRTAGASEILEDGLYGALVPARDDLALARAIEAALSHPGDPALRQARAKDFSVKVAVDAYASLFAAIEAEAAS